MAAVDIGDRAVIRCDTGFEWDSEANSQQLQLYTDAPLYRHTWTSSPIRLFNTTGNHSLSLLDTALLMCIKPKFHYADFATFTETFPRKNSRTEIMSPTFVICVHGFPRGEVLVKVGVMEFGFKRARSARPLQTVWYRNKATLRLPGLQRRLLCDARL